MSVDASPGSEPRPNVFVIGAPRSATTTLYFCFRRHPEIYVPWEKEPAYFASETAGHGYYRELHDYLDLFRDAGPRPVRVDMSTTYLSDPRAAQRIFAFSPEAKIIAILRSPVDRAFSQYLFHCRAGTEARSFARAIDDELSGLDGSAGYFRMSLYAAQLQAYLDLFPRDRVLVILHDWIARDLSGVLRQICAFLGIPFRDAALEGQQHFNGYTALRFAVIRRALGRLLQDVPIGHRPARYWLYRLLSRERVVQLNHLLFERAAEAPRLDAALRRRLLDLYDEDIARVERMTGLDLAHWRDAATPAIPE